MERKHNLYNFGWALDQLVLYKRRVCRTGWKGKNMFIVLIPESTLYLSVVKGEQKVLDKDYEHAPYLAIKGVDDILVPWVPSQTDQLAEDWLVFD